MKKSQLCHKAQTLAQMNAKLEAEILNVREDLFNQISTMKSSKDENDKLILEIHKEKVNSELSIPCRDISVPSGPGRPSLFPKFGPVLTSLIDHIL